MPVAVWVQTDVLFVQEGDLLPTIIINPASDAMGLAIFISK